MKVSEVMSRDVKVARPQDTIRSVAQRMTQIDVGSMPICEGGKVTGIVTDRDIVIRVVGEGRSFETPVCDVMTANVEFCLEDDELDAAADKMAEAQVRRLPVLDRENRLVGVLALGDVALKAKDRTAGETLEDISEPARHG